MAQNQAGARRQTDRAQRRTAQILKGAVIFTAEYPMRQPLRVSRHDECIQSTVRRHQRRIGRQHRSVHRAADQCLNHPVRTANHHRLNIEPLLGKKPLLHPRPQRRVSRRLGRRTDRKGDSFLAMQRCNKQYRNNRWPDDVSKTIHIATASNSPKVSNSADLATLHIM